MIHTKSLSQNFFSPLPIVGIMAADPKGVIGMKNGDLPWHYPEETQHFRDTVSGHIMIMGRKTFDATPLSILEQCANIILTHDKTFHTSLSQSFVVHTLEDCLDCVKSIVEVNSHQKSKKEDLLTSLPLKIFMIGGAEIAHLFLNENRLSSFLLTHIHKEYSGDIALNFDLIKDWPFIDVEKTANYTIRNYSNPHFNL